VAEALQHDPSTRCSQLSSPGTTQLDHGSLDRRLPSPARSSLRPDCGRRPGSDDELAPLGLVSVLAGLPMRVTIRINQLLSDYQMLRALARAVKHPASGVSVVEVPAIRAAK